MASGNWGFFLASFITWGFIFLMTAIRASSKHTEFSSVFVPGVLSFIMTLCSFVLLTGHSL